MKALQISKRGVLQRSWSLLTLPSPMLREGAGGGEISSMISLPKWSKRGFPSGHLGPSEVIRTQRHDFDMNCVS